MRTYAPHVYMLLDKCRRRRRRNWPLCDRCITFKCVCRYATAAGWFDWRQAKIIYTHHSFATLSFVSQSEAQNRSCAYACTYWLCSTWYLFVFTLERRFFCCFVCGCLFSLASTLHFAHLLFTRCAKQKSSNPFLRLSVTGCWFSCKLEAWIFNSDVLLDKKFWVFSPI